MTSAPQPKHAPAGSRAGAAVVAAAAKPLSSPALMSSMAASDPAGSQRASSEGAAVVAAALGAPTAGDASAAPSPELLHDTATRLITPMTAPAAVPARYQPNGRGRDLWADSRCRCCLGCLVLAACMALPFVPAPFVGVGRLRKLDDLNGTPVPGASDFFGTAGGGKRRRVAQGWRPQITLWRQPLPELARPPPPRGSGRRQARPWAVGTKQPRNSNARASKLAVEFGAGDAPAFLGLPVLLVVDVAGAASAV